MSHLLSRVTWSIALVVLLATNPAPGMAAASPAVSPAVPPKVLAPLTVAEGKTVAIEFTLTLDDGSTVQSNVGGEPLAYVVGTSQLIPGLEAALQGKAVNDRLKVRIPPEQAYGQPDSKMIQEVPIGAIPENARKVGTLLSAQGDGGAVQARVVEVRPEVVVMDLNHLLAGKSLTFDVLVLSIN